MENLLCARSLGTVQRCTILCIQEILGYQAKWYFKCILHLGERSLELPRWHSGKEPACQRRRHMRRRFDLWVRRIPWRREWQPTPVFLPGESLGQRSLAGYSPWGHKESDMTLVQFSCPVVSDSLRPHELQHTRPPCPSPIPRVHPDSRPLSQ